MFLKKRLFFVCDMLSTFNNFPYLCPRNIGVTRSKMASERVMKRESGENPEQTRCCKLRFTC